jgi:hypothetical protein
VKARDVDWGYKERICSVVGDARTRSNFLTDIRIELEGQMALELLQNRTELLYYEYMDPRSNYLLLDGGGYFGGERKFRVSLYDKCEKDGLSLLAISKNSPSLHDDPDYSQDFGVPLFYLFKKVLNCIDMNRICGHSQLHQGKNL